MSKSRRQITFDLSQEKLKLFYPKGSSQSESFYKKAYNDIQKFMLKNGFSHRQYSVYVSDRSFSKLDINELCEKLVGELPWIIKCINEIDVTYIGNQYAMKDFMKELSGEEQSKDIGVVEDEFTGLEAFSDFTEDYEYDEEEPEL